MASFGASDMVSSCGVLCSVVSSCHVSPFLYSRVLPSLLLSPLVLFPLVFSPLFPSPLVLVPRVSACSVSSCAWLLWSPLRGLFRSCGGSLGPPLGPLGSLLGPFGAPRLLLGRSWANLGPPGPPTGPLLGASFRRLCGVQDRDGSRSRRSIVRGLRRSFGGPVTAVTAPPHATTRTRVVRSTGPRHKNWPQPPWQGPPNDK